MKTSTLAVAAFIIGAICAMPALAASLQVSPVNLDVIAPGAATRLTLRNTGSLPFTAQVRVFRWVQQGGQDLMEPTQAVVASPPFIQLRPQQDYTVRIVRTSGTPVTAEEAYRVVVDELPPPTHKTLAVTMVARHVIPAFFTPRGAQSDVQWSIVRSGKALAVRAVNRGGGYLRLANAKVKGSAGGLAVISPGLVGYVHAGATMTFPVRSGAGSLKGQLVLEGQSQFGVIRAPLSHGTNR